MNKSRVEALTDGIIAIAATIMVLELCAPNSNDLAGLLGLRHIFFAYLNSFFLIYNFWYLHHDLFHHVKVLSKRAFLVNGVWIFMLTLIPFSSAWVGKAPDALLPEILYPLSLLLWSISFHWLDYVIQKDNPHLVKERAGFMKTRITLYICYLLCMILAFVKPNLSIYLSGIASVVLFVRLLTHDNKKKEPHEA